MYLSAMQNLRDVGGIPVAGGGQVASGILYRGDAPWDGDGDGGLPVWPPRTVVDLRASGEKNTEHPLAGLGADVRHHPLTAHLSVQEIAGGSQLLEGGLEGLYARTIDAAGGRIAAVAGVVADAPGPVLIHCAAGKDRTGMVIAAVLAAAGVARGDIVADYVATEANMSGVVERMSAGEGAELMAKLRTKHPEAFTAPAAAIQTALDVFDAAGGAAAWLIAQGLDPGAVARLRTRLVVQG
ncbi:hypothetical protein DSM112329_04597 [Paraconexibacter sp. AEG42_29]|uniref:Tyrosine specific protein phosphatases domain-containing protein n=1 Tax=Paraconexibacter sp. AEG42_29 TaxID=2997339 RepID=A0AAU7B147_9ACTN